MNNVRGLYPPLYGAPANGGGGGGGSIQVDTLPEASLEYKDKIVQYTGATTETLTNGYFYKCIEHTETEGETITVTYSWDNIPVMEVDFDFGTTETEVGTYLGKTLYRRVYHETGVSTETTGGGGYSHIIDANFAQTKEAVAIIGTYYTQSGAQIPFPYVTSAAGTTLVRVSDERGLELWSSNQITSSTITYQFVLYYTKKTI